MNNITMIASVGKNLELGRNNQLIWPIKEDLNLSILFINASKKPFSLTNFLGIKPYIILRKNEPIPTLELLKDGSFGYQFMDPVLNLHTQDQSEADDPE